MAVAKHGYSGKPVAEKLGYRDGQVAAFVALPDEHAALTRAAEFAEVVRYARWSAVRTRRRFDLIHAFTRESAELQTGLAPLQAALKRDGMIWVSWPKKASKVATDVTEDTIRAAALALDLVDVKVAAVDAVWSGLKLVVRKELRARH